jgi:hypothetical protein
MYEAECLTRRAVLLNTIGVASETSLSTKSDCCNWEEFLCHFVLNVKLHWISMTTK